MRKIAVQRNEISRASFMIQVENMAADFLYGLMKLDQIKETLREVMHMA